jgi:16S rRNA (cytidine1402-2'-O)-methyltransferase
MLIVGGIDIGNRMDTSPRMLNAISHFQVIVVENIESFNRMCIELGINPKAKLIEYYAPMEESKEKAVVHEILEHLNHGDDVLLMSDDGMPGIADPGGLVIDLAHRVGYRVSVFPGPSIVSTLPAVLGVDSRRFTFEDEIPSDRSERLQLLQKLYVEGRGVVFIVKNRRDDNSNFKEVIKDIATVIPEGNTIGIGVNLTMKNEIIIKSRVGELYSRIDHYNFSQEDFISLYVDCR